MTQKPGDPEGRTTDLFFQLASLDRKRILTELQKETLHLNEVAKRVDMTATEALRQLQRMTEACLLEKTGDGKYRLTPYAKLVLETSSPLGFISRFREYFLERDTSLLPCEYRGRLGELSGSKLIPTTMETLNMVTRMLKNARQKIDGTVEIGFELHQQIMCQRLAEGVEVRWLMQESFSDAARSMFRSADKHPEIRVIPRIFGHVYLTDRAAAFCLRRTDGAMDYSAFFGEDASFLKWAGDLFAHEWQNAKPWYP